MFFKGGLLLLTDYTAASAFITTLEVVFVCLYPSVADITEALVFGVEQKSLSFHFQAKIVTEPT